jgi:hypothetical protein
VKAVCLHVRRLHGVPNVPDAKPITDARWKHHIEASYFQQAVERMAELVRNPHFFVFRRLSRVGAREHPRALPLEFVTHNGADRDYEDFWLMSRCRHFIVANSTFSWWAAWLADHPDKTVIAPKASVGPDEVLKSAPESWWLI